jgi:O-antigen chain-terminating methyltransferase
MVSRCQELELPAQHADAMEYLKSRKTSSYGVISAFHMVEHIPTDSLILLLDEALRVLRPGGLLILETPNPRNIIVGSCNFYFDPTHRHPIPSELLRFQVEARGFVNIEVKPLHPVPDYARPPAGELPEPLGELLYGPQDYGLIAWKS